MTRDNSIDNIRLLAIFGVTVLHCFPFFYVEGLYSLGIAVNQLTRFAVPCFFVISGYLYAQRVWNEGATAALRRSLSRITLLYFFWCVFYVLPYNVALISATLPDGHIQFAKYHLFGWLQSPGTFLLCGSKAHLWFLPALLCATVICTPFIALHRMAAMLATGAVLFAIALLAGPYRDTLVDLQLPIAARDGPLFSTIFFAIGAMLARTTQRHRLFAWGVLLTLVGAAGQLLETFRIVAAGYAPALPVFPDFVVSTLALGSGVAMIGISGAAARSNKPWLWGAGRYTLGIYALHMFVMDFFMPLAKTLSTALWWQLVAAPLFFALTVALVLALARVRRLRPLIG